ncbi:MAG: heparinase II/III family protein [Magnetospirillum sp. WYHS-4]
MRRRLFDPLLRLVYGTPLYGLTLRGPVSDRLRLIPPDPWSGDPALGKSILDGEFQLGESWLAAGPDPWAIRIKAVRTQALLHGFSWLADLRALASSAARDRARSLVSGWIVRHGRWQPVAWRSDVMGLRLAAWVASGDFLLGGADEAFRQRFLASLAEQLRHLVRSGGGAEPTAAAFSALKGTILAGLALPAQDKAVTLGMRLLEDAIRLQILPDGGHWQRNPSLHLEVLHHLADIRTALVAARAEIPVSLLGAIDRMAPLLRALRHGDGGLAVFNGGWEDDRRQIDSVLSQAGARGQALSSAPHSGYQRLAAGRALVLVDTGSPPPPTADREAHAGALAFEMSAGKHRLIVNCGSFGGDELLWRQALRATAAHSTATVGETNSSEIHKDGTMGERRAQVSAARGEMDGMVWLEAGHDGYAKPFGIVHNRRLRLDSSGDLLEGEDEFARQSGRPAEGGEFYCLRFHLHPDVRASLVGDETSVLLRLASGGGWRFQGWGGKVKLEESLYWGRPDAARRSEQITINGQLGARGARMKWRLIRIDE